MAVATSFLVGRHYDVLEQLGDGEPSTQLEAEAVIEDIRGKKGYLDSDTMQQVEAMQTRYRDNILRVIGQLKDTEASYTRSVAEQLYSSRYRFLYELIQNADDSLYRNALNEGIPAVLRFRITPQTFVVETNEDGFTRKNVEAICATGKSSKKATATDDHIGEKGFGFKSVFSVADEVRIQSGVWSFRFEHRRGDNGLGMVTPLNAPMEALKKGITTRITLRLAKDMKKDHQELVDAVADLPKTIICFLRKLRIIHIDITHLDARTETTTIIKTAKKSERSVTIKRARECDSTNEVDTSVYHTMTHTVNDMPQDDRRKGQQSVKIDLAFPIDPVTKQPKQCDLGQYVFAYLPLQRLPQIQFLIQSDFITSANRESVIDCAWNAAICDGVAKTFTMAVERFATADHSLRYSWLDYLPNKPMEHPWKRLYPSIKEMLKSMPVLQTWEQRGFKSAHELRWLSDYQLYKNEPILGDLSESRYLAPEYGTRHDQTLEDLGVRQLDEREVIARIQADLINPYSRIKTRKPDDPWHEAFARLGLLTFERTTALYQLILKRQTVIPLLKPNQWTGAPGLNLGGLDKIYFPYTGTTQIPGDIGLHMVDRVASTNTARKAFYKALGVAECPKETVFAKIRETHQSMRGPLDLYSHLTYLFRFHDRPDELQCWLQMPTEDGRKRPVSGTFYFPSNEEYDIDQLLPKDIRPQINLELNIFPRSLVDLEPSTLVVHGRTLKSWLKEVTNAQYHPLLCKNLPKLSLSMSLKAILEHNPKKFLGTLKAHWSKYQHHAPKVCDDLRECKVPCRSGEFLPLHITYLPTVKVLEKLQKLGIDSSDSQIAILTLPDGDLDDFTCRQWRFLEDYGVCSKPDLRFYQSALELLSDTSDASLEVMKELYKSMAGLVTTEDQESLREFFGKNLYIWHSIHGWVSVDDCVWEGPDFLRYTAVLESQYSKDDRLKNFFTITLGINNWNISVIVKDLIYRGVDKKHSLNLSSASEIYAYLETHVSKDAEWSKLRRVFKNVQLVLGEHDTWHKLDRCVWKSPFPLAGYQDLHTIYPGLEDFFTKRMNIKNVRPSLLINEVKQMAEQNEPRIDDIRLRLIDIGMILAKNGIDANIEEALNSLKTVAFLPKQLVDGKLVLVGVGDDFVIPDHARYGKALESHGVALDFKVDETQILDTMFQHLGLTSRYLSVAVVEESNVEDEVRVDQSLSRQLQKKAYALYCCAAKHKSRQALRNERALFDQLREMDIYNTDTITTHLVLQLKTSALKVQSDRSFLHHEVIGGQLRIYIPENEKRRRACFRTQLPKLLTSITGTGPTAVHDISTILLSNLRDLDDILIEQDISEVSWIEKPVIDLSDLEDESFSFNAASSEQDTKSGTNFEADPETFSDTVSDTDAGIVAPRRTIRAFSERSMSASPSVQYRDVIDQIIRSAQSTSDRENRNSAGGDFTYFDRVAVFGTREMNEYAYNRRVGAAGEAFVFERLSTLHLPRFTRENWQSTIRGELAVHPRYADLEDWSGRETADLVYMDRHGFLTQYLRDHCDGGFPIQIPENHDHARYPIEYYLEVKSTPGMCNARFFMSNSQYKLMEDMAMGIFQQPKRVYVILRVYDLTESNVGLKSFVDPWRLRGTILDFSSKQWVVKTR